MHVGNSTHTAIQVNDLQEGGRPTFVIGNGDDPPSPPQLLAPGLCWPSPGASGVDPDLNLVRGGLSVP